MDFATSSRLGIFKFKFSASCLPYIFHRYQLFGRQNGSAPFGKESELEKVSVGKKVSWKKFTNSRFLPTPNFSNCKLRLFPTYFFFKIIFFEHIFSATAYFLRSHFFSSSDFSQKIFPSHYFCQFNYFFQVNYFSNSLYFCQLVIFVNSLFLPTQLFFQKFEISCKLFIFKRLPKYWRKFREI